MKAAELRQSILQAAVQGKLVPQNVHDEPASELLKRIQQGKTRLIKEGKIKKEKPLPPVAEDEVPYDLPDGWVWCRLGDICTFINGDRSNKYPSGIDLKNAGIPFVNSKNIINHHVCLDESQLDFITEEKFASLRSGHLQDKDIVFVLRGSVGKFGVFLANEKYTTGFINAQIVIIRVLNAYILDFLMSYIKSNAFSTYSVQSTSGSAVNQLSASNLSIIPCPLPPLSEQQCIVTKVDELMVLCDELEAAEKELDILEKHFEDYLPKSILQAAVQGKLVPQNVHDEPASELLKRIQQEKARLIKVGKIKKEKPLPSIAEDEIPYDLPEGWVWCRLGSLCDYGSAENAEPTYITDDSWVLELEDIEKDTGALIRIVEKLNRNSKSTKHIFSKGNVLYSKLRPYLNKVIVAERDGYCTSEILPLDLGEIDSYYAVWFLRSPVFVEYANGCSYGVKMPRLGTEDGRMALFPLPPLAEQQRIVAKVDELMTLCDELKTAKVLTGKPAASNVVPFPQQGEDEELLMVAQGEVSRELSKELRQAQEDLFGDGVDE